ncbi:Sodium/hydrogen exchanger 7 [Diplonema papillatum]|nr:Sodium/hydrogen exchanger 7 [Diplonema papillatum]
MSHDAPVDAPNVTEEDDMIGHVHKCFFYQNSCHHVDLCIDDAQHLFHDTELHDAPYAVLVLAGAIGIGALLRFAAKEIPALGKIPHTIAVFLAGLIFGGLATIGDNDSNLLGHYVEIADIDPHLIFHVFLPILIFESAFSIDIHIFKKVVWHCLILAAPGLVVASGLTAAVAKLIFSNWTWIACLLLGAILSATDPVAVVALLKDLGCSAEISTLIEGESLFNDGTAIVIFSVLKDSVPAGTLQQSPGEIVWELIRVSLGGPLIGLIAGLGAEFILSRVFNDHLIEVSISVAVAYVTFFVAESYLHVSGVLALVVLGLYLSDRRQCFSPEVEHTLHEFWGILVFMANTIIFSLAGIIVATRAFFDIDMTDILYLLILYAAINVIRVIVLALFYPFLKMLSYKVDMANLKLVAWGGLRGAVGLSLALILENDEDVKCQRPHLGPLFIFIVSGIVILTLVVNGVTTGWLVSKLNLAAIPQDRLKAMQEAYGRSIVEQEKAIYEMSSSSAMAMANWNVVKHLSIDKLRNPFASKFTPTIPEDEPIAGDFEEGRSVYFKLFITELWQLNNIGVLSASALRWLLESVQKVRDTKQRQATYTSRAGSLLRGHDLLDPLFDELNYFERATKLLPCAPLREGAQRHFDIKRLLFAFEITTAYIQAHDKVADRLSTFKLENDIIMRIRDHCKAERSAGLTLLGEHQAQCPKIAVALKTRQAARVTLNRGREGVRKEIAEGRLDPVDGALLVNHLEMVMEDLRRHASPEMDLPETAEVLETVYWASRVEAALHKVLKQGEKRVIPKGSSLVTRPGQVCVICAGVARESLMGALLYYGPGHTVGLLHALTNQANPDKVKDCIADTEVTMLSFEQSELMFIARQHPDMLNGMWQVAGTDASMRLLGQKQPYINYPRQDLRQLCKTGIIADASNLREKSSGNLVLKRGFHHVLLHGAIRLRRPSATNSPVSASPLARMSDVESQAMTAGKGGYVRAVALMPDYYLGTPILLSEGAKVYSIPTVASGHNRAVKMWGMVSDRISLMHTCVTVLTERPSCRKYRTAIIATMMKKFFKGLTLETIMGGPSLAATHRRISNGLWLGSPRMSARSGPSSRRASENAMLIDAGYKFNLDDEGQNPLKPGTQSGMSSPRAGSPHHPPPPPSFGSFYNGPVAPKSKRNFNQPESFSPVQAASSTRLSANHMSQLNPTSRNSSLNEPLLNGSPVAAKGAPNAPGLARLARRARLQEPHCSSFGFTVGDYPPRRRVLVNIRL